VVDEVVKGVLAKRQGIYEQLLRGRYNRFPVDFRVGNHRFVARYRRLCFGKTLYPLICNQLSEASSMMSLLNLLLFFLGALLPSASPNPLPSPGIAAIPPDFRSVLFYDDFSSTPVGSLPDASKWTIDTGTSYPGGPARWGTNEVQTYTARTSNVAIRDGNLVITPQRDAVSGAWTSARIETVAAHDFSCLAGQKVRIEARLKVGAGARETQMGIWPAFWSLGSRFRGNYHSWPSVGEIDILETLNGEPTAWHTVHCGPTAQGGPCKETTGLGATSPLSRGDWHVLAVEIDREGSDASRPWEDETMTWSVDGKTGFKLSGRDVGDKAAWASLAQASKFLLLNVAVGGSFPDAIAKKPTPNAQTLGGDTSSLEVQYVAVFST